MKTTEPEAIGRPSSYRHREHTTLLPASRRQDSSTSELNRTMIHESPMRQSRGCADSEFTIGGLEELSTEWQLKWHHQDSEPSSQESDGRGRTRPSLKTEHNSVSRNTDSKPASKFTKEPAWSHKLVYSKQRSRQPLHNGPRI